MIRMTATKSRSDQLVWNDRNSFRGFCSTGFIASRTRCHAAGDVSRNPCTEQQCGHHGHLRHGGHLSPTGSGDGHELCTGRQDILIGAHEAGRSGSQGPAWPGVGFSMLLRRGPATRWSGSRLALVGELAGADQCALSPAGAFTGLSGCVANGMQEFPGPVRTCREGAHVHGALAKGAYARLRLLIESR